MMFQRNTRLSASAVSALILACSVGAEAKPVEAGDARAQWTGKGQITEMGEGAFGFAGSINGTMFIRHPREAQPDRIHAAHVQCQTVGRIWADKEDRQSALCVMTAHEGKDVAYGEMHCFGKKDQCRGEYTFTYGTGAFDGISGTTPFVGGINIERTEEGVISGYAEWPHLTYSLPTH